MAYEKQNFENGAVLEAKHLNHIEDGLETLNNELEQMKDTPGKDGKSAYEIAKENGFVGTKEEWLKSLVGPSGKEGPIGPQGERGLEGQKGDPGEKGDKGDPGKDGQNGQDGSDGLNGKDGFSPIVEITQIEGGHLVKITDNSGSKTFTVMDGKTVTEDGEGGEDGFSPIINIVPINGGHRVEIIDKLGSKTFDVLNGIDGNPGEQGPAGQNGEPGKDGIGIKSIVINSTGELIIEYSNDKTVNLGAVVGSDGEKGIDGESAYDIAKKLGFSGSQEDWLLSLKGEPGANGKDGQDGKQGEQGPMGPQGPQGETGPKGEDGKDGTGVSILGSYDTVEELLAAHPTGNIGDSYIVGGSLYVWNEENQTWTNVGNIQGPKGDPGEQGEQGPTGATGATGPQGDDGQPGKDGIGISKVEINTENHLVITLTDGTVKDLGKVVGENGANGSNGEDGKDGIDGKDGKDGVSITEANLSSEGNFSLVFSDGKTVSLGNIRGQDGQNGIDGQDGIGITKAEINSENKLIITLSNGESFNLGVVVGSNGKDGTNGTNGEDGKDGADGVGIQNIEIENNGNLKITLTNNNVLNLGNIIGPQGEDGDKGLDGIGIINTEINSNNELVIYYSNGTNKVLGKVVGKDGQPGTSITHEWIGTSLKITSASGSSNPIDLKGDKGDQGPIGATGPQGPQGEQGPTGETGPQGPQGTSVTIVSITPSVDGKESEVIFSDGNKFTIKNGVDGAAGSPGEPGKEGKDGLTPFINNLGNWQIGDLDTEVKAKGEDGSPGATGSQGPEGPQGPSGLTPFINEAGNWQIGDTDTGKPARGEKGETGETGAIGPVGPEGPQGPQGEQGIQGIQGIEGPQGPEGPKGSDATVTKQSVLEALNYTPADADNTYTKEEVDDSLEELASMIGSGGGSGEGKTVQSDWEQTNEAMPSFIKNKPFEENSTITETSTPDAQSLIYFTAAFNNGIFYKIFDTVLTQEQIQNEAYLKITTSSGQWVGIHLYDGEIIPVSENCFLLNANIYFVFASKAERINYNGTLVEIPQPGMYLGVGLSEGPNDLINSTFELSYTGIKTLDSKYISRRQADFTQDDSTKDDFIKNRPFYPTKPYTHFVTFGLDNVDYNFYKIGDFIPKKDCINEVSAFYYAYNGEEWSGETITFSDEISYIRLDNVIGVPLLKDNIMTGSATFVYSETINESGELILPGIYITEVVDQINTLVTGFGLPAIMGSNCVSYKPIEPKYTKDIVPTVTFEVDGVEDLENGITINSLEDSFIAYSWLLHGTNANVFIKMPSSGNNLFFPFVNLGVGLVKVSILDTEYYFSVNSDTLKLQYVGKKTLTLDGGTEVTASTYSLRGRSSATQTNFSIEEQLERINSFKENLTKNSKTALELLNIDITKLKGDE